MQVTRWRVWESNTSTDRICIKKTELDNFSSNSLFYLVAPVGFEPTTKRL